jgi:hypothetical protein
MMEAVGTPETSVYFNGTTRRYIPESSHLQKHFNLCQLHFNANIGGEGVAL